MSHLKGEHERSLSPGLPGSATAVYVRREELLRVTPGRWASGTDLHVEAGLDRVRQEEDTCIRVRLLLVELKRKSDRAPQSHYFLSFVHSKLCFNVQ